jgi:amidase
MRRLPALAALLAVSTPAWADPGDDAAAHLVRIAELDDAGPRLNAVIVTNPNAPAEARAAAGLPLGGRTVLVKDNIETREWPTTAGSLALADYATGRDAPLIARLRGAGGVVLGKTNLSEWANIRSTHSTSGWSAVGGLVRNPYATDRNSCGSSSGSGAAVAAGMVWAAIGTETDGSITCPASVNGIVGFKPTVGMVSRTHVVPISHSQDTAGPMARTVADAALLLNAIAGSDPADVATAEADAHKVDLISGLSTASLAGVRIGVLRKAVGNNTDVAALFEAALADLRRAGAELVDIDFEPDEKMGSDEFFVLQYELREDLNAYLAGSPAQIPVRTLDDVIAFDDAHKDAEMRWFGQEIFLMAAKATDAETYQQARANSLRLAGADGIDKLLAEHTVSFLIAPTAGPAWSTDLVNGDNYNGSIGAGSLAAIAGYPHLSVPMGAVTACRSVSASWARSGDDAAVLRAGRRLRTRPHRHASGGLSGAMERYKRVHRTRVAATRPKPLARRTKSTFRYNSGAPAGAAHRVPSWLRFAGARCAGVPAHAQDASDASRVSQTTEQKLVYTPADFARYAPRSALDMLQQVPGFNIQESFGQGRGLGEATGNVLINGERISSKSDTVSQRLGRIAAANVVRIEFVDGATLDIPGLSGRVANIITKRETGGGIRGSFEWTPQLGTDYSSTRWAAGRASITGRRGPVAFTFAVDNQPFYGGTGGPNFVTYGNGTSRNGFNHTNSKQNQPRISTQLRIDGPGSSIGNFSALYQRSWNRSREDEFVVALPGAPSLLEQIRTHSDGHNYELGGDFEVALGPGRLKLIGLESYRASDFTTQSVIDPDTGAAPTGSRFSQDSRSGERIGRAEYKWKMFGGDWQLSARRRSTDCTMSRRSRYCAPQARSRRSRSRPGPAG